MSVLIATVVREAGRGVVEVYPYGEDLEIKTGRWSSRTFERRADSSPLKAIVGLQLSQQFYTSFLEMQSFNQDDDKLRVFQD